MGRENKNRPQEVSSKKPVPVLRQVVEYSKKKYIDPRFDRAFGHFNKDLFEKTYGFLGDLQKQERRELESELKRKAKDQQGDTRRSEGIRLALDRIRSLEKAKEREDRLSGLLKERKRVEQELVTEQGKQPFYLKKADIRRLEMVDRYKRLKSKADDKLQSEGAETTSPSLDIDRIVESRRKRKASKQHRLLPNRSRN